MKMRGEETQQNVSKEGLLKILNSKLEERRRKEFTGGSRVA
jgi:hypothetical protein